MTDGTCEDIRDKLVDYADGELSDQEAQIVRVHLAECPTCRDLLRGLERSLDLAQTIWSDNLHGSGHASAAARPVRIGRAAPWLAVAAGVLIVAGTLVPYLLHGPVTPTPSFAEIEQQATRAATAARLLVATQILAGCADAGPLVERQRQYILRNYPDTPAAAKLRTANSLTLGDQL